MATDAKRQIVRDADSVAVYRAEPLITRDQYERIQARLAQNDAPVRVNTSPLLRVAFCALCGGSMHSTTTNRKSYPGDRKGEPVMYAYRYYHCHHSAIRDGKCSVRRVKADPLESLVIDKLLEVVGHVELTEDKLIPGRDYSEEIAKVVEQIGHLTREISLARVTRRDVTREQAALDRANAELDRLASLEPVAARIEPVKLGKTFRAHWESLDTIGRNEFMRANKVTARVVPLSDDDPLTDDTIDIVGNVSFDDLATTKPEDIPSAERTVIVSGHGMRITLDLGNLARLRKMVANA
jgi:site-specific DNA recombinase